MIDRTLRNHAIVVLAFLFAFALVTTKVLLSENGYVSPDGTNYLGVAANISAGEGPFVSNDGRGAAVSTYFAVWPIGYPLFVAGVAKITGSSVFIASKILNLILLAGSMAIVMRTFSQNGPILALILLFGGSLEIFSLSASEGLFIFLLMLFSMLLGRLIDDDESAGPGVFIALLLAGIAIFLTRYIGLFVVAPAAVVSVVLYARGRFLSALFLLAVAGTIGLFAAGYLYINQSMTGFATGMERIPAPESPAGFLKMLGIGIVRELVFPIASWEPWETGQNIIFAVYLLICGVLAVFLFKAGNDTVRPALSSRQQSFLLVGLAYFGAIVLARWLSQFDNLNYRLLGPGTVLITVATFDYLLAAFPRRRTAISAFMVVTVGLAFLDQARLIQEARRGPTFYQATEEREARYRDVPDSTIVIFGDMHQRYLRPDLHLAFPMTRPYSAITEDWSSFIADLDSSRDLFIDGQAKASPRLHESAQRVILNMQSEHVHRFSQ
ncbi:hypothetical protein [Silicimonas sp. MF1-12-2]|uniref:hypothetical protein n=1 Tax=Silicimonas sp. MF1-12-2 TaxID=3384793 RepID=UPI0039B5C828